MRPRGTKHLSSTLYEEATVELITLGSYIVYVDVLACTVGREGHRSALGIYLYARGPVDNKYYEMTHSTNRSVGYIIKERVWRPNYYHEELFYDYYHSKTTISCGFVLIGFLNLD